MYIVLYLLYLDYTVIFSWCTIIIFRKKEIISKEFKNLGSYCILLVYWCPELEIKLPKIQIRLVSK